jgi:phosphoribosylformylglycinamidine synthase
MQTNLGDQLLAFISKGNLVLGICNGFQTLVNMGLLPGFALDYTKRQVALTYNDCGNFRDDWIPLKVNPKSPCVFTQGMDRLELPIRHGEGKFVTDDVALRKLSDDHQVVIQYATPNGDRAGGRFPYNPNGSLNDIAGICDPTGRVFGLMPHPEAYNHWTNHPNWTIKKEQIKRKGGTLAPADVTLGIRIFQNAVQFLQKNAD